MLRTPLIQFQHVDAYVPGRETPVLEGITLTVSAGEWLGVVGRNGCGKSVLGKLIAGLDGRYSGELRRDAQLDHTPVQWVMQNPEAQLIGETVWDDIVFGLENLELPAEQIREDASMALKQVGLYDFKRRSINSLSGGQKQLLALAGAIAMKPAILVADEITSMLDPASRLRVIKVLQDLHKQGTALVMITQLLEELVLTDRVIALEKGHLAYEGSRVGFFYEGINGGPAACERLGLRPPYTIQVAKELQTRGIQVKGCPLTPDELGRAVQNETRG